LSDAVEPEIKQRFEAVVTPKSNVYVKDPTFLALFKPYVPIVSTVNAKSSRTLYGVALSTYRAGKWATVIDLENSIVKLGTPRDFFSQPTVICGSQQETRIEEWLSP
jgi:hypothetical protein